MIRRLHKAAPCAWPVSSVRHWHPCTTHRSETWTETGDMFHELRCRTAARNVSRQRPGRFQGYVRLQAGKRTGHDVAVSARLRDRGRKEDRRHPEGLETEAARA